MCRVRDWVPIERDDFEGMAGQGDATNFRRAAVQNVKENALTLLDSNGFAMTKHPAVNGKVLVTNFVAVRHAFGARSFHSGFADFLERSVNCGRRQDFLSHVTTPTESRLEFFQNKKDFAIVPAWIVFRLDVNRSNLAAVLARRKIDPGAIMCVIEAQTGWIGREPNAALAMCRNVRRAF